MACPLLYFWHKGGGFLIVGTGPPDHHSRTGSTSDQLCFRKGCIQAFRNAPITVTVMHAGFGTASLLPTCALKGRIAGKRSKLGPDRLWRVLRAKQVLNVISHERVTPLKGRQRPTCRCVHDATDNRRSKRRRVVRSLAKIVEGFVVSTPFQRTSDRLHNSELAGGSECSPHHVQMPKEIPSRCQVKRILERSQADKFIPFVCGHTAQHFANIVTRRAED